MSAAANRQQIRQYLLGTLSEGDQQKIEQSFFDADEPFAEVLNVEDELIETYLQKKLDARERSQFETHFLSTERGRQKLALSAVLQKMGSAGERPGIGSSARRTPMILAIAASLFLLATSAVLLRQLTMTRRQMAQLENRQLTLHKNVDALTSELEKLRSGQTRSVPEAVFSMILSAGQERGAATRTPLILPREATAAELWLIVPAGQYQSYSASLQSVEGRELWVARSLQPRVADTKKAVSFRIPSEHLSPGTYVVALSGQRADGALEPVEDFVFTVRRP